jgi:hypothetical protein
MVNHGYCKGPTEGGSGGKRGHSGMEHWGYTEEVKRAARKRRRLEDKKTAKNWSNEESNGSKPRLGDADSA